MLQENDQSWYDSFWMLWPCGKHFELQFTFIIQSTDTLIVIELHSVFVSLTSLYFIKHLSFWLTAIVNVSRYWNTFYEHKPYYFILFTFHVHNIIWLWAYYLTFHVLFHFAPIICVCAYYATLHLYFSIVTFVPTRVTGIYATAVREVFIYIGTSLFHV